MPEGATGSWSHQEFRELDVGPGAVKFKCLSCGYVWGKTIGPAEVPEANRCADCGKEREDSHWPRCDACQALRSPPEPGPVVLDVTIGDLAEWAASPVLGPLYDQISKTWDNEFSRCGHVIIENERGNYHFGKVTLMLRFPLPMGDVVPPPKKLSPVNLEVDASLCDLDEDRNLGLTAFQCAVLEDWFLRLEKLRAGKK